MGTTLQHGIFLPAEGERNCYAGLASNWTILDGMIGGYSSHAANLTIHVTAADKEAWNGKADASALTAHTGDTTIHVTAADKEAWNGKQDALSQTQLDAVNSGIDSSKVQQIATNTSDISSLQSGKANDNSVVHTSGNETVGGKKTFRDDLTIYNNDSSQNTKNLNISSSKIQVGDTSNSDAFGIRLNAGASFVAQILAVNDLAGTQNLQFSVRTKDSLNNFINSAIRLRIFANGNSSFEPGANDSISLGFGSLKYKDVCTNKVNGVEPSSLGMPVIDRTKYVDISGYFTNTGNGDINTYSVTANGWIYLRLTDIDGCQLSILDSSNNRLYGSTSSGSLEQLCLPVTAGTVVETQWTTSTSVTVAIARFIPCRGNI